MPDEEFAEIFAKYPDYFIEITAEGEIIIRPPNDSFTSAQSLRIARQLGDWADSGCGPRKMQVWIDHGIELAWLIDPQRRAVEGASLSI